MNERTFVIIKPDAVAAGHVGNILNRYEEAGFRPEAMDMRTIDGEFSDQHYAEHLGRDYYPPLREFMTEGPLVAMILTGKNALAGVRELNGATDPAKADVNTIRADFGTSVKTNCVHASDSPEAATSEIGLWFPGMA